MTPAEAINVMQQIINAALKAGLFQTIEDAQTAGKALAIITTLNADKSANDEPGNN